MQVVGWVVVGRRLGTILPTQTLGGGVDPTRFMESMRLMVDEKIRARSRKEKEGLS